MKISFNIPEKILNDQIEAILARKRIGSMEMLTQKATIHEVDHLKDGNALRVHGNYKFICRTSFFTTPILGSAFSVNIQAVPIADQLQLQFLTIDCLSIVGFSANWKNRWLTRILNWSRAFLIQRVNKEMEPFDWEKELINGVLGPLEKNILEVTGLQLQELDIHLLSIQKDRENDLWISLDTIAVWSVKNKSAIFRLELFPPSIGKTNWQIFLDDELLKYLARQYLSRQNLPADLDITTLSLKNRVLCIEFTVRKPVVLQLQWSASLVFDEEGLEFRGPNMTRLDHQSGWKEKLALPGIRWLMHRKWSEISKVSYSKMDSILNKHLKLAIEAANEQLRVESALRVEHFDCKAKADPLLLTLSGNLKLQRLD
jgi:hypothetical protein